MDAVEPGRPMSPTAQSRVYGGYDKLRNPRMGNNIMRSNNGMWSRGPYGWVERVERCSELSADPVESVT